MVNKIKRIIYIFRLKKNLNYLVIVMRKYNSEIRRKLVNKITKITEKSDLVTIYNIVNEDIGDNYSTNRNGIFINLNSVSDKCIDQIIQFLDNINFNITETEKLTYTSYNQDDVEILTDMGHKLSNQEKIIIKRLRSNN